MIDPKNLKIGDIVYYVSKTLRFPRKKFTFVDDENNLWHRYEDMYDFNIKKKTVCGYVVHEVHGIINSDYENGIGEFYFQDGNGKLIDYGYPCDDISWSMSFLTEDEAKNFIKNEQEKLTF